MTSHGCLQSPRGHPHPCFRRIQADGTYEGDLVSGVREGKGTLVWPNGDRCASPCSAWPLGGVEGGTIGNGWMLGIFRFVRYIGEFKAGMRHGTGTLLGRQGGKYEGEWAGSLRHGVGKETWPNGERVGAFQLLRKVAHVRCVESHMCGSVSASLWSACLSVCPSACLSVCPPARLPVCLVCLCLCLSVCLVCLLRPFLCPVRGQLQGKQISWTWGVRNKARSLRRIL
jgi:hypothetical protein